MGRREKGKRASDTPVLRNIGAGPAFNILIDPLDCSRLWCGFAPIPYLETQAEINCDMQQNIVVASTEYSGVLTYDSFLQEIAGLARQRTIEINFCDVVGTAYSTKYTIQPFVGLQGEEDRPSEFFNNLRRDYQNEP